MFNDFYKNAGKKEFMCHGLATHEAFTIFPRRTDFTCQCKKKSNRVFVFHIPQLHQPFITRKQLGFRTPTCAGSQTKVGNNNRW